MSDETNCIICSMPLRDDGCERHDAEDINEYATRVIAVKTEELRRETARANAHQDEVARDIRRHAPAAQANQIATTLCGLRPQRD